MASSNKSNRPNLDVKVTELGAETPPSLPVETPGMRLKRMITKRMTRVIQSSQEVTPNEGSTPIQAAQLFCFEKEAAEVSNSRTNTVTLESLSVDGASCSSESEAGDDVNHDNKLEEVAAQMEQFYNYHCNTYPVLTYEP